MAEREHVAVMFHLFSILWIIATALNFVMASDPYLLTETSMHIRDFGIGALLGVTVVILIEFMRGFFIEPQDESDFLRLLAFTLNVMGIICWGFVLMIIFLIIKEYREIRHND